MIMKTVQKGSDKIEHVEYGDNVIYFFSSRNIQGRNRTEMISKRITSRIIREYTDEEYNTLLETVVESVRNIVSRASSINIKRKHSCRLCTNGICRVGCSCSVSFA